MRLIAYESPTQRLICTPKSRHGVRFSFVNLSQLTKEYENNIFERRCRCIEAESVRIQLYGAVGQLHIRIQEWKKDYFRLTIRDWRRVVVRNGFVGLTRPGGIQFDRGPNNERSDTLKRLELQVTYLKAENDFLATLRAKRAESNSSLTRNTGSSES